MALMPTSVRVVQWHDGDADVGACDALRLAQHF